MKKLAMIMMLIPLMALADTEIVDGIPWTYTVSNGKAEIRNGDYSSAIPSATTGSIAIPSSLGGYPVMSIGGEAFYECRGLTSVTIPSSVTSIGNLAFSGCSGLTSVTMPSSVTSIGFAAFQNCSGLTSVMISSNVTSIGESAFYGSRLTSVAIPSSVTRIGERAFSGCSGLMSISVDVDNLSYGSQDGLLYNKMKSELIRCPEGKTGAVTMPSSVTSIGDLAFSGCSGLTSVTMPSSVTSIGESAFSGCSGLTSVTIPSSVTSIGNAAFAGCAGLTLISVDANNPTYGTQSGILYNKTKSELMCCPCRKTGIVIIPAGVTSIGDSAFSSCSGLTSVTIPSSVTSIGNLAFSGCSGLTSVTIPSSVTNIGDDAFCDCSGLSSVMIPSSVTSIGVSAFSYCSGLTSISVDVNNPSYSSQNGLLYNKTKSELFCCPGGKTGAVTIPSSVTRIGYDPFTYLESSVFSGCSGVTSISVNANNPSYSSQAGILYNKTKSELIRCPEGKTGAVTIPSSVTSIGVGAFGDCNGLTSVTMPSSVTSIEFAAFRNCSGLTSVTIPASVTSIGGLAFSGCSGLTSVTMPSSVTSIGYSVFVNCNGLTSVTIPPSVASIGAHAFDLCSSLKTIYVAIGDTQRIKNMLSVSGMDVSGLQFVESGTVGEGGEEGDGGGFDGSVKHTFNGLVRDANNEPCGLIQVTTAKATKKGVKVGGFVMLEDGKKVTMKAVTVAAQNGLLAVSTTVGKLGNISLTIGGDGFAGTFGAKKVASEKLDEDIGVLKTTVKVTYLDAATGKLKTKNMTLNGFSVPQSAAGVLTSKGSAAKEFEAVVDCEACRPE